MVAKVSDTIYYTWFNLTEFFKKVEEYQYFQPCLYA